jgi:cytidine deaminase
MSHGQDESIDLFVEQLKEAALSARRNAYAPYSQFHVGAAVVCANGVVYSGCNVENAAYGSSICAERVALTAAIAAGAQAGGFRALAVVGQTDEPITPCGACRQVIAELCSPHMPVWLGNLQGEWQCTTVADLLPGAFTRVALLREEQVNYNGNIQSEL